MFGTLRYSTKGDASGLISHLRPCETIQGQQKHLACNRCRSKKLKCSGQKSGCNRCKLTNSRCYYTKRAKAIISRPRLKPSTVTDKQNPGGDGHDIKPSHASTKLRSPDLQADMSWSTQRTVKIKANNMSDQTLCDETGNTIDPENSLTSVFHPALSSYNFSNNDCELTGDEQHYIPSGVCDWLVDIDNGNFLDSGYFQTEISSTQHCPQMYEGNSVATQPDNRLTITGETLPISDVQDFSNSFGKTSISSVGSFLKTGTVNLFGDVHISSEQVSVVECNSSPEIFRRGLFQKSPALFTHSFGSESSVMGGSGLSGSKSPTSPAYRTPTSATTNDNSSTFFDTTYQNCQGQFCHCLQAVAAVLDNIDIKAFSDSAAFIDATMNLHRESLSEINVILNCGSCITQPARSILLLQALERLVSLIERACHQHA